MQKFGLDGEHADLIRIWRIEARLIKPIKTFRENFVRIIFGQQFFLMSTAFDIAGRRASVAPGNQECHKKNQEPLNQEGCETRRLATQEMSNRSLA